MTATKTPTTGSTRKPSTRKGTTASTAPAALAPVPAEVLAECLQTAPGKTVTVDLVTGEVIKTKPARKQGTGTLSGNMVATLQAMKDGTPMTHNAIAAITGRDKGNKLRELTALGMVTTSEVEGTRGYVFTITPAGTQALAGPVPEAAK